MNKGSFNKNCELLLIHVNHLNQNGKLKICNAGTKFLANAIGKSERQVYRYLDVLEARGLIKRSTTKLLKDKKTNKRYRKRQIVATCEQPESSGEVLRIHFNDTIHGRIRNRLIREFVKSDKFVCNNMASTVDSRKPKISRAQFYDALGYKMNEIKAQKAMEMKPVEFTPPAPTIKLDLHMPEPIGFDISTEDNFNDWLAGADDRREKEFKTEYERLNKICEEYDEGLAKKEYNFGVEAKATQALKDKGVIHKDSYPQNAVDLLVKTAIKNYRDVFKMMENIEPATTEAAIMEKVESVVGNARFDGSKYMVTIYLDGSISHDLPLLDYVPWDIDSEFYKVFVKMFKGELK